MEEVEAVELKVETTIEGEQIKRHLKIGNRIVVPQVLC